MRELQGIRDTLSAYCPKSRLRLRTSIDIGTMSWVNVFGAFDRTLHALIRDRMALGSKIYNAHNIDFKIVRHSYCLHVRTHTHTLHPTLLAYPSCKHHWTPDMDFPCP